MKDSNFMIKTPEDLANWLVLLYTADKCNYQINLQLFGAFILKHSDPNDADLTYIGKNLDVLEYLYKSDTAFKNRKYVNVIAYINNPESLLKICKIKQPLSITEEIITSLDEVGIEITDSNSCIKF